ncbi:hypothetical protein L7F22_003559 [Adiantum nelumboides]|nr:hypothetical protein [Adiantum nelumboides]
MSFSKRAAPCTLGNPSAIQAKIDSAALSFHGSWGLQVRRHGNLQSSFAINYASLLRSYALSNSLIDGMCLHAHIIRHNLDSTALLGNLLVQMYGQCGALDEASAVFASLLDRDQFAWNFLIRSYATNGPAAESLLLFQQMLLEGVLPDRFILGVVWKSMLLLGRLL